MTEVLEHVENFDDALSEIWRVLSPGGRLILTWPLCYQLHDIPQDYWRFTEFAIGKMLCDRGFQVENLFRRGDLTAVVLTLLGTAVSGGAEALRRVPKLGWMLRIVASAADWALSIVYRLFVCCSHRWRRLNPVVPGESLRGLNSLALWTLGYCAVARKVSRA